ncbi:unnamed protein product [Prorocentrum cordatum]|uniref:Uncharacterized protein n=1 Tax=Prorocentrum cordatum TaxID=2364126 RepID=A0ABN9TQ41_9DINO|nr:unnamed protein product [Polarella glacialis]
MYGTTSLEAFLVQLKSFFRNVFHQTLRNASIVCKIATVSKIFGAYARTAFPGMNMREHEALLSFCQNLLACPSPLPPPPLCAPPNKRDFLQFRAVFSDPRRCPGFARGAAPGADRRKFLLVSWSASRVGGGI